MAAALIISAAGILAFGEELDLTKTLGIIFSCVGIALLSYKRKTPVPVAGKES